MINLPLFPICYPNRLIQKCRLSWKINPDRWTRVCEAMTLPLKISSRSRFLPKSDKYRLLVPSITHSH